MKYLKHYTNNMLNNMINKLDLDIDRLSKITAYKKQDLSCWMLGKLELPYHVFEILKNRLLEYCMSD